MVVLLDWQLGPTNADGHRFAFPAAGVIGASLALVAVVAFGGMLMASLRARVAVAACFVLVFLLTLTYAITISQFGNQVFSPFAQSLVNDFRAIVQTVIAFYFGSEALISGLKVIRTPGRLGPDAIMRADRDLPSGS